MVAINPNKDYFVITLLGILFFIPFLGGVHLFDWDEINFAEAAREMIVSGDYFHVQIDFQPFWEKPPLFIWLQVISMELFGINEFAARFPNAICGIITLLFLFSIGKKLHSRTFGWIWVLAYLGSILPHLYFRSGIIDPWFNLLIFSSLYYLILTFSKRENTGTVKNSFTKNKLLIFGGILLGLAVLTKGPVALLIVGLTGLVVWARGKFSMFFSIGQILIYGVSAMMMILFWFGIEWWMNGSWFIREFIAYQIRLFSTQDAGHGGFFGYHFVVLFLGCFPSSIFAIPAFWKSPLLLNEESGQDKKEFRKWMVTLFWVVLILFSMVQSKIVHYSSLCYFPLTYLAATYLYHLNLKKIKPSAMLLNVLFILGLLISIIFIALPFVGKNIEWIRPLFQNDQFALANLEAEISWSFFDALPGVILFSTTIFSFLFFRKKYFGKDPFILKPIVVLFGGTSIFIALSLYFLINKIEGYSQNAAIEFYKSLEGKNVYIKNIGFKSYATLFYFKKQQNQKRESRDSNWLIKGEIDKAVYFIAKIKDEKVFDSYKDIKEIGRKNGFIFFQRKL